MAELNVDITIYVVMWTDGYDINSLREVFSTKEKAEAYIEENGKECCYIEERELK